MGRCILNHGPLQENHRFSITKLTVLCHKTDDKRPLSAANNHCCELNPLSNQRIGYYFNIQSNSSVDLITKKTTTMTPLNALYRSLILLLLMIISTVASAASETQYQQSPFQLDMRPHEEQPGVVKLIRNTSNSMDISNQSKVKVGYTTVDEDMENPDEFFNETMQLRLQFISEF